MPSGAAQYTMILFYLSIPIMLIGITIALAPLLWAMTHAQRLDEATIPTHVHHEATSSVRAYRRRAA
ncbi:MAG TPA: hypothetical protein VII76_10975 [Acidimicrobiales bacterium]